MDENDALTEAAVKALAYQENGGKPDLNHLSAGKSGELKSIFQFTPDTWKHDAKTYLGDENAPLTPDAETTVMLKKVRKLVDEGKTVKQIASMHNAGTGEPNAYTGKFTTGKASIGVNDHGVKYNVPSYADGVAKKALEFYQETKKQPTQPQQSMPQSTPSTQPQPKPNNGLMGALTMPRLGASSVPFGTQQ